MKVFLMLMIVNFDMLMMTNSQVMQKVETRPNVCFVTEDGKKLLTSGLGMIYKRHILELAIDLTSMHYVEHIDVKYTSEFLSRYN